MNATGSAEPEHEPDLDGIEEILVLGHVRQVERHTGCLDCRVRIVARHLLVAMVNAEQINLNMGSASYNERNPERNVSTK
jgi:hypothetical protein